MRSRLDAHGRHVTEALEASTRCAARRRSTGSSTTSRNWYVRRSRPRFWKAATTRGAHATLHECLATLASCSRRSARSSPTSCYANLHRDATESVHLADWPVPTTGALDAALEAEMARARAVVSLGLAARTDAKLKVRQPLRRAFVLSPTPDRRSFSAEVAAEIADALNVKQLEAVTDLEGLLDYTVVPNFRRSARRWASRCRA